MSDEPAPRGIRPALRRAFSFMTSLPAVALLTCALLVNAMLLPEESTCRLWPRRRTHHYSDGFGLVRTQDELRPVLSDQGGFTDAVGLGRFSVRTAPDPCFWAPLSETLRVEIVAVFRDGSAVSTADRVSIGGDLADLLKSSLEDSEGELLRAGGGSKRRLHPGGCVHNLAAGVAFILVACGAVRVVRSEVRSARERRRLGRDQCPHCGYARTGGPPGPCPECGRR